MKANQGLALFLLICVAGCGSRAPVSNPGPKGEGDKGSADAARQDGKPVTVEMKVNLTVDRQAYVLLVDDSNFYGPKYTGSAVYIAKDKIPGFGVKDNNELMDRYEFKK